MANANPNASRRQIIGELVAPIVWSAGAITSSCVGLAYDPLAAVGTLGVTMVLTILAARLAIGWRSVPVVFAMLALQAPILHAAGFHALSMPVGEFGLFSSGWAWTPWLVLGGVLGSFSVAAPMAFVMRHEGWVLERARWCARRLEPIAMIVAVGVVGLALARLARFPAADRYVDALPVQAIIPASNEQPCEPLSSTSDEDHPDSYPQARCATPEVLAGPFAFHYHCHTYIESPELHGCELVTGHDPGGRTDTRVRSYRGHTAAVPLLRDDALDMWLLKGPRTAERYLPEEGGRWTTLRVGDLRDRTALPLGWILFGAGGLVSAVGCMIAWRSIRRLALSHHASVGWIAARRGDLAIVSVALMASTCAFLFAGLIGGFLT